MLLEACSSICESDLLQTNQSESLSILQTAWRQWQWISVAPYIDAKNLHDVTVVAGDRVKFDLKIFGEPTPEVVWTKEGVDEPLTR